jgi:3-oxoacyl-[acyl-carrier-protein] synthase-1
MEEKMAERIAVIVADNIVSPLGFTTEDNYAAVKDGRSALQRYEGQWGLPEPFMAGLIDREAVLSECRKEGIGESFTMVERMAILSITKAVRQCQADMASDRTLLILSSTKGDIEVLLGETAKTIATHFGMTRQPIVVSNACISGVCAQIEAWRMIKAGLYDHIIVCGVDVLCPFIVTGFQSLKALTDTPCRPFDEERTGINLGDAAATIVYEAVDSAEITDGTWYVANGSIRNDAFHISSPSNTGEGCYRALQHVMAHENVDDVAFLNAHGTATLFNDEMESVAIDRAGLSHVPVNSLKGYYGHTMGAAGVLESVISMHALDEGIILGTRGFEALGVSRVINVQAHHGHTDKTMFVKMMSGFGGCNAAMLFKKS